MAVALRSPPSSDVVTSDTDTTLAPGVPTNTANGDLLVAIVVTNDSAPTTPSGWSLLAYIRTGQPDISIYTKTASSESGNYSITVPTYNSAQVAIFAFSGADTSNVDYSTGNSGNSSSGLCNNLEAGANGSVVLWIIGTLSSSSSHATLTEIYDSSGANARQLGVYSQSVDAGTITGPTLVPQWSTVWSTLAIGVRPAAAGGSVIPNILNLRRQFFN